MNLKLISTKNNRNFIEFFLKKKLNFIVKKKICNKASLRYYFRKVERYYSRKMFSDFFYIFKKMECITGNLPVISNTTIRLKNKNKKKQINKKFFVSLSSNFNQNVDSFFDYYILLNFYSDLKTYIEACKKTYSLEEFFEKKKKSLIFMSNNLVSFNKNFFVENIIFNTVKRPVKFFFKERQMFYLNSLTFKVTFFSNWFNIFLFKIFFFLILNEQKILLFLYKYYRNKFIKI